MSAYRHFWGETLRSTIMVGYARSDPINGQPDITFVSSDFGALNLMWQLLPYVNIGVGYAYGSRKNNDGTTLDNQRVILGFQFS